jgi:hypothetical protein
MRRIWDMIGSSRDKTINTSLISSFLDEEYDVGGYHIFSKNIPIWEEIINNIIIPRIKIPVRGSTMEMI